MSADETVDELAALEALARSVDVSDSSEDGQSSSEEDDDDKKDNDRVASTKVIGSHTLTDLFLSLDQRAIRFAEDLEEVEEEEEEEKGSQATAAVTSNSSIVIAEGQELSIGIDKDEEEEVLAEAIIEQVAPAVKELVGHDEPGLPEVEGEDSEAEEEEDDEEEESESDEELPVTLQTLEILNTDYKDHLSNALNRLYAELQANRARQQDILLQIQEMEEERKNATRQASLQHVSVSKRSLLVFGYPYFKDVQLFYPPNNEDTLRKRANKEPDVWLERQRLWRRAEQSDLKSAVKKDALKMRLRSIRQEREELDHRLHEIGLRDHDRKELTQRMQQLDRIEADIAATPDHKLFEDRDQDFDWVKISYKDLHAAHSPQDCELHWKNLLHPSWNRSAWTPEEDLLLKRLAEATDGEDWDAIASELGTSRPPLACFVRYMTKHHVLQNSRAWSRKEDVRLRRLVAHSRVNDLIPWAKVSYYMNRRTKDQCYQRYVYSLRENIRHGIWEDVEEWLVLLGERLYGSDWAKITDLLQTRTPMQVHCHFQLLLNVDLGPWTQEEDIQLLESVRKHGLRDWVHVAEDLKHRGRTQCRNRFQYIYTVFQRNPVKSLQNIVYGKVKASALRQRKTFEGLDEAFRSWLAEQQQQVDDDVSRALDRPFPGVDPEGRTVLPNGMTVLNRDLCRFMRTLQARLTAPVPPPLDPLPPPHLRTLPNAEDELPDRPLTLPRHVPSFASVRKKINRRSRPPGPRQFLHTRRSYTVGITALYSADPVVRRRNRLPNSRRFATASQRTAVDREISKLFRPTWVSLLPASTAYLSPRATDLLLRAEGQLARVLDFSRLDLSALEDRWTTRPAVGRADPAWDRVRLALQQIDKTGLTELSCGSRAGDETCDSWRDTSPQTAAPRLKTYSRKPARNRDPAAEAPLIDCRLNLVPPNRATLLGMRGLLLHADYTRELADRRLATGLKILDADRVARDGIENPDIYTKKVDRKIFDRWDLPEVNSDAQQEADRRLARRLVQLMFWPARMSTLMPPPQETLFTRAKGGAAQSHRDSLGVVDDSETTVAAANPFDPSAIIRRALDSKVDRKETTDGTDDTTYDISFSSPGSVLSVYSENPSVMIATPPSSSVGGASSLRTYSSRKRKLDSLSPARQLLSTGALATGTACSIPGKQVRYLVPPSSQLQPMAPMLGSAPRVMLVPGASAAPVRLVSVFRARPPMPAMPGGSAISGQAVGVQGTMMAAPRPQSMLVHPQRMMTASAQPAAIRLPMPSTMKQLHRQSLPVVYAPTRLILAANQPSLQSTIVRLSQQGAAINRQPLPSLVTVPPPPEPSSQPREVIHVFSVPQPGTAATATVPSAGQRVRSFELSTDNPLVRQLGAGQRKS